MDGTADSKLANEDFDQPIASPNEPRVWTVFLAVFLALVATVLFQSVVAVTMLFREIARGTDIQQAVGKLPEQLTTPAAFILLAACGQLAFGLGAVVPAWLSPMSLRERLGLLTARPSWSVYPLAMFGSLVPLAIGFGLAEALALILPPDPSVRLLYQNMTLAASVPFVLFIALAPGVLEELMFRGYVQRRLLQRWNPAWAIGVTSVVFAIVHITPHAVVAVFPLGLWFGVVAWRSNSVGPSILCHAFVNGSVNAWRMVVKFGEVSETIQTIVLLGSLLVGLVCLCLALRCFVRQESLPG